MTESKNLILEPFHVMQFMVKDNFEETPNFSYYKYMGSLTTPPCEEYVNILYKPFNI
jgi:carbonic anhydrase